MHKFDAKNIEKLDNPQRRKEMPPRETLEKFGLKNIGGANFLDIGCGIGYFTIGAAEILEGGTAIGIDLKEEMLEHAWERADVLKNVDFRVCEEYKFPVDDKSIDYAMISNVLHEIKDKERYLLEVRRVLKDEGELYIIEWKKSEMEEGPSLEHRLSSKEVQGLLAGADFKDIVEVGLSERHYGIKARL